MYERTVGLKFVLFFSILFFKKKMRIKQILKWNTFNDFCERRLSVLSLSFFIAAYL